MLSHENSLVLDCSLEGESDPNHKRQRGGSRRLTSSHSPAVGPPTRLSSKTMGSSSSCREHSPGSGSNVSMATNVGEKEGESTRWPNVQWMSVDKLIGAKAKSKWDAPLPKDECTLKSLAFLQYTSGNEIALIASIF